MAAQDPTEPRMPRTVSEGKKLISDAQGVPVEALAAAMGVDEETLDNLVRDAIAATSTPSEFKTHLLTEMARHGHQTMRSIVESGMRSAVGTTPVANGSVDLTALGREVSGLDGKVNILLAFATTLVVGLIAGAITLWQAIGGVETRLARELGQVETRITQQIADVRSEVGEIRGRLSVLGQAGPTPPR